MMNTIFRKGVCRAIGWSMVALLATSLVLTVAATAGADDLTNNLGAGGSISVKPGVSTTITYKLEPKTGGGETGCNVGNGNGAQSPSGTVTVIKPAAVTATQSTLTITNCSTFNIGFASSTPGQYPISVTITGGRSGSTYDTSPANFVLKVDNSAPVVTVPGPISTVATSPAGSSVPFTVSALDDISGSLTPTCVLDGTSTVVNSPYTFPIGMTKVVCSATDAADGEMLIPATVLASLVSRQRQRARREAERASIIGMLTPREREVLRLMAQGLDNKAIAAQLIISLNTVRTYVQTVLEKLGVHSKLEAVARASEYGLLDS